MEQNSDLKVSRWVSERLAKLGVDGQWRPNVAEALERFEERRDAARAGGSRWTWTAVGVAVACAGVLMFPTPRAASVGACEVLFLKGLNVVSAAVKTVKEGQAAPDFTLKDAGGADLRLAAYKGRVVLLDFWATWCGGCNVEIPWFAEFQSRYKDRGLAVVGVSMDEDGWKVVKPFLEKTKMNYAVVIGTEDLAKRYGVEAMPMTFLIDRGGKIAASHIGLVDKARFEAELVKLLGK